MRVELRNALKKVRDYPVINIPVTSVMRFLVRSPTEEMIRYLPRTGRVQAELPNGRVMKLWSRADDFTASPVFWRGWDGYEPETARLWYDLAQHASVILDIGAHVGYFTLLGALANRRSRVFGFEPHPVVRERLLRNVSLNALDNVEVIAAAAGRAAAKTDLFVLPGGVPTNSSLSWEYIKVCNNVEPISVDVLAIDDFVRARGLEGVDLVKIDTETTESDVLAGMRNTLLRCRPAVVCEILSSSAEDRIRSFFSELGYVGRRASEESRNYLFEFRS